MVSSAIEVSPPAPDPTRRRSWRDFFLGSDPDTPPPDEAHAAEGGRTLKPGDVLGDWEILDHLGSGGMSDVFKAYYRRDHRRYALKVLSAKHRDSPGEVARFELEYLALTRIRHQGIVAPFVAGREDGVPFYAMELLDGESLERALTRRRLSSLRAAQIGAAVAASLAAIHAAKIIHRDIKPGNIFLESKGGVKLLDLGIAKLLPEFYVDVEMRPTPEARPQTRPGVHLGTCGYIAPETAQGAEAAPAQDIYGLGVTLWRAVTGGFPYSSILPPAPEDEPKLDSESPMHPALEDVLRRALAVRPLGRQASMIELREELELVIVEIEKEIAGPVAAPAPAPVAPSVIKSAAAATATGLPEHSAPRPMAADDRASSRPRPPLYLREFVLRGLVLTGVLAVYGVGILAGIRSERAEHFGLRSAVTLARGVARAAAQATVAPGVAAAPDEIRVDAESSCPPSQAMIDAETSTPVIHEDMRPTAPAKPTNPPPRRRGLTRGAFNKAIVPIRTALGLCVRDILGAPVDEAVADITAEGDVEGVRLSPASTYIATRCVERTLRGVRFPRAEARSTHRINLGPSEAD